MRNILTFLSLSAALGLVTGCDSTKEALGLKRERPDEFSVLERRPLTVPPGYGIRPPEAGLKNTAEIHPEDDAKAIVNKGERTNASAPTQASAAEKAILQKAAKPEGEEIDNIRATLAEENPDKEKAPGESMVFWKKQKQDGDALDAQKEYERTNGKAHPSAQTADQEG